MEFTVSCSAGAPTRSIRNTSDDIIGSDPSLPALRQTPTWQDLIFLASTIKPTGNAHHAGHRTDRLLSTGSFAIGNGDSFVVRGLKPLMCPNSTEIVAAKIPAMALRSNSDSPSQRNLKAVYRELRILAHPPLRSHENIVELLGIAWMPSVSPDQDGIGNYWPVLLLEYSLLGSLEEVWQTRNDVGWSVETRLRLALDVSRGLKVLHDCDIIHGDLKCENVLVFTDESWAPEGGLKAKISDFGYAITEPDSCHGLLGRTPPWNPPEDNLDFNFLGLKAADMYTLGFVLWRVLTDGEHPFVDLETGDMMPEAEIAAMKRSPAFWQTAYNAVARSFSTADMLVWPILGHMIEPVFFSALHTTPLDRSLRHIINTLEQADLLDLAEVRRVVGACLDFSEDGELTLDLSSIGSIMMGEVLKKSIIPPKNENTVTISKGDGDTDRGSLAGSSDSSGSAIMVDSTEGSSREVLSKTPSMNLKYWNGTEEEAQKSFERIQSSRTDPLRHFCHPVQDKDSDTAPHHFVAYHYESYTPEEMRQQRQKLVKSGTLPQVSPSQICTAQFNFTFSDQKGQLGEVNKSNKTIYLEGISMLDSLAPRIVTRLQKEQPGVSVRMVSQSLDRPEESIQAPVSSRSQIKITTVLNPVQEVLQLIDQNGGYVEEDAWSANQPQDSMAISRPNQPILSANFSFPDRYSSFWHSLAMQPWQVRQRLVKEWSEAHHHSSSTEAHAKSERRQLARMLATYYLEVEFDEREALRWLLLAAEDGDEVIRPVMYRMFSALGVSIPEQRRAMVENWVGEGVLRGSPFAMDSLSSIDDQLARSLRRVFRSRTGGLGICVFTAAETLFTKLAERVARFARLQKSGDYLGRADALAHLPWAMEIASGASESPSVAIDSWNPEYDDEYDSDDKHWQNYGDSPRQALRDTFRIEEDVVYAINAMGDTVLHYAASRGYLTLLEFLVQEFNPPLTVINIQYETPLLQSCRAGHWKVAQYLADQGAAIDIPSRRGELPLHWAAIFVGEEEEQAERDRFIGRVLEQKPDDTNDGVASSLPHHLAGFSPTEIHIASGSEPQIGTVITISSPLEWAIDRGNLDALSTLLRHSAALNDEVLLSAIFCAAKRWESECLLLLCRAYHERQSRGPDLNTLYLCLFEAVRQVKTYGIFYQLLRHAGEESSQDWLGAFQKTRHVLTELGAKPRSTDTAVLDYSETESSFGDPKTVIALAAAAATPNMVADLLAAGFHTELQLDVSGGNPNSEIEKFFPIALAVTMGRHDVVREILKYEDSANLANKFKPLEDGYTAFYGLADGGKVPAHRSVPLARELLSLGIGYYENGIRSPFEAAVRNHDFALADLFLHYGADIERGVGYGDALDMIRYLTGDETGGSTAAVTPTLLGCLILEHAAYLVPCIVYLIRRGARPVIDTQLDLNIFHMCAVGGAEGALSDGDTTRRVFAALQEGYAHQSRRLLLSLDRKLRLPPVAWAAAFVNVAGLESMLNASATSGGCGRGDDIGLLAVARMALQHLREASHLVIPNDDSRHAAALVNAEALLGQIGLRGKNEDFKTDEGFWVDWLEQAAALEDKDNVIRELEERIQESLVVEDNLEKA